MVPLQGVNADAKCVEKAVPQSTRSCTGAAHGSSVSCSSRQLVVRKEAKPSERIEQLTLPIIEQGLRELRSHLEKSEQRIIPDEDWNEYLVSPNLKQALGQLRLNALLPAIILYLDEQAEGKDTWLKTSTT